MSLSAYELTPLHVHWRRFCRRFHGRRQTLLDAWTHQISPYLTAILIFGFFGATYFGTAALLRVAEVATITKRIMRRR